MNIDIGPVRSATGLLTYHIRGNELVAETWEAPHVSSQGTIIPPRRVYQWWETMDPLERRRAAKRIMRTANGF